MTNHPITELLSDEALKEIEVRPETPLFPQPSIRLTVAERDALCATVRVLREELECACEFCDESVYDKQGNPLTFLVCGRCWNKREQEVAALREQLAQENQQRGLVLLSALTNFVDWLFAEGPLSAAEKERGQLVLRFLAAHSEGKNYFMQADQIAEILGEPFREEQP